MERILQKIGRIREYLSLVRSIRDDCLTRFATDPVYRGALIHYLCVFRGNPDTHSGAIRTPIPFDSGH
jgi:hypothetical protein